MFLKRVLRNLLRSLQWRLVFIFITMAILLIIPVSLLLKGDVESSYYNAFKEDISAGAAQWKIPDSYSLKARWEDLDKTGNTRNAIYFFNITSVNKTYTIIDTTKTDRISDLEFMNNVILSTDSEFIESQTKFDFINEVMASENYISALANKTGSERKSISSNKKVFFDYAFKKGNYILYFRYYNGDWSDTIGKLNSTILNSCFIAIIASLIIGYILSKTITVPIVNIMHKAQELAKGNFDQVLHVKSEDEIGKLTKSFNFMANELKHTLNEISSEKNKIETILNYMNDGVIAFNLKGEVIHANPASKSILGVHQITEGFNEFAKKFELATVLEDVIYSDLAGNKEKNIFLDGKYIKVYFALFTDEDKKAEGIIVVLNDITEQQKLENMRREFVANVSHELRTPLTSIKSYTETILDGLLDDRETSEKFLGVINAETDRMTRLVKDLLQLSRLEYQQMQWNMQEISFVELAKNSVESMQIAAKNKGQILESFVIGEIPEIKADYDRIEQVIINIIGNAVKYTPEGGSITVYIGKLFHEVYMKVTDTGIGIPQKDLPRIFERFYRVDKARSREMGGTGLGLSIAKEIIEAHGGTITIHSEPEKGTEVVMKLPIEQAS